MDSANSKKIKPELFNPFVSIVLPVYSPRPEYLSVALQSIAGQSFQDFELIISDDSREYSNEIQNQLNYWEDRMSIRYFRRGGEKPGIFRNLNCCLKKVRGNFIQFFCQDDFMRPGFIETQLKTIQAIPSAGMCFSQFDVIDNLGNIYPLERRHDYRKSWPSRIRKEKAANYFLKYGCMPGNLSPVMIRKAVIEQVGLMEERFDYAGDFEYWIRISKHFDLAYQSTMQLSIRRHPDQASKKIKNIQLLRERISIYRDLLETQTIRQSKKKLVSFINSNIGVLHFHCLLKQIVTTGFSERKSFLHLLNTYPFHLSHIVFFYLISLNGRIKWVDIPEREL